ncbi:MAG: ABC transporter ATP-binding protein [Eubacteriales bacterium]|nr:ABC transporter ATP-binding protein [Eubacteriales bacterium]
MANLKMIERSIPGANRGARFATVQYAEDIKGTLYRIIVYFMKEKGLVISMLGVVMVGTLCGVWAPSLQSHAIDVIAGSRNGHLMKLISLMLAAYLIYSVSQLLQGMISARLSQRIVKRLRKELFDKIMDLPIQYLDVHSSGDIMSRMTNDIENISTTVSTSLPSMVSGIMTIIGTVVIMFWYCPKLAFLSWATVILTILAMKILSKQVRKYSRKRQQILGELNGTVEEIITGYRTVVAYNHQGISIKEFCDTADSLTKAGIRTDIFSGIMGPIMNCISNIGFVIIAVFGGYFATKGIISVGVISAFIVYAKQFSRPVNEIAQIYGQLQTAIAGAERVFAVMDEEKEDQSGDTLPEVQTAQVEFQHVKFSYQAGNPVLQDFSMTIPAEKKIAVVGLTGSGKTTVVNLLMRFYDIDSGTIRINGKDIAKISRESLRKEIAIVLQDTVLFSDTIRNNLLYGNAQATEEQLKHAVAMSRCEELIRMMPDGYDTFLTNGGANISQGQRQLLTIARAFVADPKILIFDEATSNVDTRTEKAIQDAMHQVMKNRTGIIIAHRLSTIRDADMIVVMDHGNIVENGTHQELIQRRGKYYELYQTQYAGFAT